MSLFIEPVSDRGIIVHVGAHLDFRNASAFKSSCDSNINKGVRAIIVNFQGTNILDKAGLAVLLRVYQQLNCQGGHLVLADVSPPVQAMLYLTRTSNLFPRYETIRAALQDFPLRSEVQPSAKGCSSRVYPTGHEPSP